MPATEPRLVHLTIEYLDGYRWVELHELDPDDQPRLPVDGPRLHSALVLAPQPSGPLGLSPRFDGDAHPTRTTVLVAPTCQLCLATDGATFAVALGAQTHAGATHVVPVCARHDTVTPSIGLDHLADWTGHQVLWGALTDPFVVGLLAVSDELRGVQPEPAPRQTYAHELARGERASVFADHLRVDAQDQLWLPTWARVVPGIPGTDVPISRRDDGLLHAELGGVALERPIRRIDADAGDFVVRVQHDAPPAPPAGHEDWIATSPDHASH